MKQKNGNRKRHVRFRHRVYFFFGRAIGWVLSRVYGFRYRIFRVARGRNYLIISNHQTLLDPPFLAMSFRAPVYFVAGETLFNDGIPSRLLRHCFAPIKKRKGEADAACIRSMVRVAREGGNVAIFPEGNRSWANTRFYVDPSICSLIRLLKLPLLLYRFEGGFGVDPRWGRKRRRGRFVGAVYREISAEEIATMSDEALYEAVLDGLTVVDGAGDSYRSGARAEYLERLLFICPKCGAISSLRSRGDRIACSACGLSVVYGEDLRLSSSDADFPFSTLEQWYRYQLFFVRGMKISAEHPIFRDADVVLYEKTGEKRSLIAKGECVLTDAELTVAKTQIPLKSVRSVSVVGGGTLVFCARGAVYILAGSPRFNAIKYALVFNVLPTGIKEEKYYGLHI